MQIMIDIETLSTESNAAITSIGAVAFEFNKGIVSEFYSPIDIADAIAVGGSVCGYTLKWLLKQTPEMVNESIRGTSTTREVITKLRDWIMSFDHHVMWANAPSFDLTIIKNTMSRLDVKPTWKYYHERDYRTFIFMAESLGFVRNYTPKNTTHNALEDARKQAEELIKAHNFLWELKSKADDRDLITFTERNVAKQSLSSLINNQRVETVNAIFKRIGVAINHAHKNDLGSAEVVELINSEIDAINLELLELKND